MELHPVAARQVILAGRCCCCNPIGFAATDHFADGMASQKNLNHAALVSDGEDWSPWPKRKLT